MGTSGLVVARLQMSFLYFQAAIAKLPHAEWADGSAMYYWANDLSFGAPGWLHPVLGSVVSTPVGVAALTWGPILIEISHAATLLLPQRIRWVLTGRRDHVSPGDRRHDGSVELRLQYVGRPGAAMSAFGCHPAPPSTRVGRPGAGGRQR